MSILLNLQVLLDVPTHHHELITARVRDFLKALPGEVVEFKAQTDNMPLFVDDFIVNGTVSLDDIITKEIVVIDTDTNLYLTRPGTDTVVTYGFSQELPKGPNFVPMFRTKPVAGTRC